jgi:DNA-binding response OmpR family regulator
MAEILCVEDSQEFQILIAKALQGHSVKMASTLREATSIVEKQPFDLVVLDLALPDGNGIQFLEHLNGAPEKSQLPVFVLTSSDELSNKIAAFSIGVEDYICKPFNALEFKARVDSKLRKAKALQQKVDQIEVGDLSISVPGQRVFVRNSQSEKPIDLTSLEFRILRLLAGRPDCLFTREQLIDQIWGVGTYISDRTVDTHISRLRKKLLNSSVRIDTVFGEGYRLLSK